MEALVVSPVREELIARLVRRRDILSLPLLAVLFLDMTYETSGYSAITATSTVAGMVQNTIVEWLKRLAKKQSTNSSKTKTK